MGEHWASKLQVGRLIDSFLKVLVRGRSDELKRSDDKKRALKVEIE